MMKLIDLSQPFLDGGPNCPVHPLPVIRFEGHTDGGPDSWQMEYFEFASHTGSHVDAPRHKIAGGATLSDLPLATWAGPAVLLDLFDQEPGSLLTPQLLAERAPMSLNGQIVLLGTGWGQRRERNDLWWYQSPRVTPDGARWLVEQGIKGVGIDHYSVGGIEADNAITHEILLGNGIWILEELLFAPEVRALSWPQTLLALPLNVPGASGAPCRPVLQLHS